MSIQITNTGIFPSGPIGNSKRENTKPTNHWNGEDRTLGEGRLDWGRVSDIRTEEWEAPRSSSQERAKFKALTQADRKCVCRPILI
jgi:hypothetical protein